MNGRDRSRSRSRRESAQGATVATGQNQSPRSRLRTLSASSRAASPLRSLLDRISLPIHGLRDRDGEHGDGRRADDVDDRRGRGRTRTGYRYRHGHRHGHGRRREREREELFVPVDPWRTQSSDVEGGLGLGLSLGFGMGWASEARKFLRRKIRKEGESGEGEGDVEQQAGTGEGGEAAVGEGNRTDGQELGRVTSLATSPLSDLPLELDVDIESLNLSCPVPSCALPLPFCPHFTSLRTHRPPTSSHPAPAPVPTPSHPTVPPPTRPPATTTRTKSTTASSWLTFLSDTVPRQVYLHILMRLPRMYFGRVARIFEDAEVSRPDVGRLRELVSVGNAGIGGIGGIRGGNGRGGLEGEFEEEVEREVDREMEWMGEREFGTYGGYGYGYGGGGYRDYYDTRSTYEVRSPRSLHERLESRSRADERADDRGRSMRSPISAREGDVRSPIGDPDDWDDGMSRVELGLGMGMGAVSPALVRFKRSWEAFVDSLIKEWKTFNLVSALLLSCVPSCPLLLSSPITDLSSS